MEDKDRLLRIIEFTLERLEEIGNKIFKTYIPSRIGKETIFKIYLQLDSLYSEILTKLRGE